MKNKKGFTLLELIIVIGIISIMVMLGSTVYSSVQKRSRDIKRKSDLYIIRSSLQLFKSDNSFYPSRINNENDDFNKNYLKIMPSDPKSPIQSYTYTKQSGCNNTTVLCTDYTISAKMEGTLYSCSLNINCGAGIRCNFCLGPNGEK